MRQLLGLAIVAACKSQSADGAVALPTGSGSAAPAVGPAELVLQSVPVGPKLA